MIPIGAALEQGMDQASATGLRQGVEGVLLVAVATIIALLLDHWFRLPSLVLIFILPVVALSGRHGLKPGLLAACLGALSYNFFLVPPRFTLRVTQGEDFLTLVVFLIVAIGVGNLAARLRRATVRSAQLSAANLHLRLFAEHLSSLDRADEIGPRLIAELEEKLDVSARLFDTAGEAPADLSGLDWAAACWSASARSPAGRGCEVMAGADWFFQSCPLPESPTLVVGVARSDADIPVAPDDRYLFTGLLDQARQAALRIGLAQNARQQLEHATRARTRDTVLAAIGHDLRTPMTTLRGQILAVQGLPEERQVLADARSQILRLESLVRDVLEMARLTAGGSPPDTQIVDLVDIVADALSDLPPEAAELVELALPNGLPMVCADPRMLRHLLGNLVSNAVRHGQGPKGVGVRVDVQEAGLAVRVTDKGPGLGTAAETLFDRIVSGPSSPRHDGAGLGLAIVKGFADAMGLAVSAANQPGGGACFTVQFPASTLWRTA